MLHVYEKVIFQGHFSWRTVQLLQKVNRCSGDGEWCKGGVRLQHGETAAVDGAGVTRGGGAEEVTDGGAAVEGSGAAAAEGEGAATMGDGGAEVTSDSGGCEGAEGSRVVQGRGNEGPGAGVEGGHCPEGGRHRDVRLPEVVV